MTAASSEMCLTLRAIRLRSYSKSFSDHPTASTSDAIGPQISRALSSVSEAIASDWPIGPIHSGPETRLSERSTGCDSGRKQCIGSESSVVSGCSPAEIDKLTSSAVGELILQPSESST